MIQKKCRKEQSFQGSRFSNGELRALIVPLLFEQFLNLLVGMVDMVMISGAGEAAISGVSIVNEINNLAIQVLGAIGGGGAVIISQYLGFRDKETANRSANQLFTLTLLISVLTGAVCVIFHTQILEVLYGSVEADVMESAKTYFWITALSFPFLGLYNSGTAIFRSMEQTKVTMYASVLMNGINIVGNYIGVYLLHQGVAGVAVPTLVSRMAAAALMLGLCLGRKYELHAEVRGILRWDAFITRLFRLRFPMVWSRDFFRWGKFWFPRLSRPSERRKLRRMQQRAALRLFAIRRNVPCSLRLSQSSGSVSEPMITQRRGIM